MIDERTGKNLKDFPILDNGCIFIYVMLNSMGRVKIGKSTNMQQRYQSLGGSNSQGVADITKVFVSEPTYLYTIETIMHDKFDKYRIPNTEWFYDTNELSGEDLFIKVCETLQLLFSSTDYKKCNEIRKEFWERIHKVEEVQKAGEA